MHTEFKIAVLLSTMMGLLLCGAANAAQPKFNVVTKRADDKVEITSRDDSTTISIRSPTGISSATISRSHDQWPERLILRLHLQGLEGLKLSNGQMEFVAEVSPDNKRFLHLAKSPKPSIKPESTRLAESEIRSLGNDGQPKQQIPLKDGYFEVRLPKELFATNPQSITIQWIDFYR